jgi:hypothetical protein
MNFDDISSKVKAFSKTTIEEVQKLNEIRQLKGKINDNKKQIRQLYLEIGQKVYEQYKEDALNGYEKEIETITEKLTQIDELKHQVRDVRGVVLCPCCHTEVPATEKYCSNCGIKMPETSMNTEPEEEDDIIIDVDDFTEMDAEDVETDEAVDMSDAVEAAETVTEEAVNCGESPVEIVEEPEETAESSETEESEETAESSEAEEPEETAESSETEEPEEIAEPSETEEPEGTTDPSESE